MSRPLGGVITGWREGGCRGGGAKNVLLEKSENLTQLLREVGGLVVKKVLEGKERGSQGLVDLLANDVLNDADRLADVGLHRGQFSSKCS